ncbi:hypothetical protein V5799_008412 [Amblyomma americanum]|uniref:Secreted protein n=1 Tax=Amblyomma americanum TaxID=6943 RepID=A0AAQ4FDC7_AMBAM
MKAFLFLAIGLSSAIRHSEPSGPPKLREFSFPSEVSLGEEIIVVCVVKKGSAGALFSHHVAQGRRGAEAKRPPLRVGSVPEQRFAPHRQSPSRGRRQLHMRGEELVRQRQLHSAARRER